MMQPAFMVLVIVGATPALASAADVQLRSVKLERPVVELFERCELTVDVVGAIKNPYDPQEVSLEATFQPPHGNPMMVNGFYYQPMSRLHKQEHDGLEVTGPAVWKVRFSPRRVGFWSCEVKLITPLKTQTLPRETFEVVPSARRGFLSLDSATRRFRFDRGESFIPIGENLCWTTSAQPLNTYDQWLWALARQRANFIRVWLASWHLRLETKETGLGRYDQARAWQLDYLLEQSERLGLYWQLCLLDHGSFSQVHNPDWPKNPYNEQLGGICRQPDDFLTSPRAKKQFQQLLRYLVSRWGDSPVIATWELFNEADLSDFRLEHLPAWVEEMSQFLRSLDVNRRPITISFHQASPEAVWKLPTIDLIQLHPYDFQDFTTVFSGPTISRLERQFNKPVMVGEFGWISDFVRQADRNGIHLHDGMWSSVMGGAVGGALGWYWDSYIHPNHLESHFGPLVKFWRGERIQSPLRRLELTLSDSDLLGCGIGAPQRIYLWVKNRTHNVDQYLAYCCEVAKQRLQRARGQPSQSLTYPLRIVRGATATIKGFDGGGQLEGRYRIEWWDTYQGKILSRSVDRTRGGALILHMPDLAFDMAAKLVRLQWWERD